MRDQLRHLFYNVMPEWLLRRHVARRLRRRAARLAAEAGLLSEPAALVEVLWPYFEFRPIQIRSEIIRLLDQIRPLRPRAILEIGAASGGTTFLFSRTAEPGAAIVSIDIGFDPGRSAAVRAISRPGIALYPLCRDSHQRSTVDEVRSICPAPLDFLFVDGDHTYDGVRRDYEMYSALVRSGGLIAFHDIVPDRRMRTGEVTHADVGGVPIFWAELKARFPDRTEEIVEHPGQDGYGIGLLRR
jgi:predicted O-methyltransferase YrrM